MSQQIIVTASATPARSLAKTVSWRALGSLDTMLLGWLFTGSLAIAGSIASAEVLTKIVLYYLHERAWAHIGWGQKASAPLSLHDPAPVSAETQAR